MLQRNEIGQGVCCVAIELCLNSRGGGGLLRNVHCDLELGYQLRIDCRTEDESNSRCR